MTEQETTILRWHRDCWIIEYQTRIKNRKAHLLRVSMNTIPEKENRNDVLADLKQCQSMLKKYQNINFDNQLSKEDLKLLENRPGRTFH